MVDRLQHLEDKDAYHRLQITAEVPLFVRITNIDGESVIVKGRADWTLGYGQNKSETGSVLVCVEAKPFASVAFGLPQLLVYMVAIFEARATTRVNNSVLGMVSDGEYFTFLFLDGKKKLFVSRIYDWRSQKATILAYIDMMLLSAIKSSPRTTPQKIHNRSITRYSDYSESMWELGIESDEKDNEEDGKKGREEKEREEGEEGEEEGKKERDWEDEDDDMAVDIVKVDGVARMRNSRTGVLVHRQRN